MSVKYLISPKASADTHSWFEIDQDGAGDIVFVVCLVKEHIFPIALSTFCPFFQLALGRDPVLSA